MGRSNVYFIPQNAGVELGYDEIDTFRMTMAAVAIEETMTIRRAAEHNILNIIFQQVVFHNIAAKMC